MQLFIKIVYCCIGLLTFNTFHLAKSLIVGSFPCGKNCTCTNNSLYQTIAQCSNLKAIPLDLPRNITELDLSWNQITFYNYVTGQDMCKMYTNMTKVSFAWNGITEIPPIFSGCLKLAVLDLTGNKVKSLSSKTLQGLDKVKNIIGLEVEELQSDTFKGFFKLEILNLTFYGITMQPHVFTYLSGLKRLYLTLEKMMIPNEDIFHFNNGNSLKVLKLIFPRVKEMPANLLYELNDLEFLSLDAPSLPEFKLSKDSKPINLKELEILRVRKLDPDLLDKLELLETLKLHEISQVAKLILNKVPLLKELEVVHCSFPRIPSHWLSNATALETLNLSDDELTILDPKDFSNLKSLKHLVLSNNKLINLPSFFLEPVKDSLQQLIINNNQLETLEHDAISTLSIVEVIDISFNFIDTIGDGNFLHLPQLKILDLKTNYISALKPTMFTTSPLLIELNLADNYFHTFPMEVIGTGVIEINLSGNRISNVPGKKLCATKTLRALILDDNPINCDCDLKELLICELQLDIKGKCNKPQSYAGIYISEFTGCPSVTTKPLSTSTTTLEITTVTTTEQFKNLNKQPTQILESGQSEIVRPIIWSQKLPSNEDDAHNDKKINNRDEQTKLNNQSQESPDDVHPQTKGYDSNSTEGPGSTKVQGTDSEKKWNVILDATKGPKNDNEHHSDSEVNQSALLTNGTGFIRDQGIISEKKPNVDLHATKESGSNEGLVTSSEKKKNNGSDVVKGVESIEQVTSFEKIQNGDKILKKFDQETNSENKQNPETNSQKSFGLNQQRTNSELKQYFESTEGPEHNKEDGINSENTQNTELEDVRKNEGNEHENDSEKVPNAGSDSVKSLESSIQEKDFKKKEHDESDDVTDLEFSKHKIDSEKKLNVASDAVKGLVSGKQEISSEKNKSTKSDVVSGLESNKKNIFSDKKEPAKSDDGTDLETNKQEINSEKKSNAVSDTVKVLESNKQEINSEKESNAEPDTVKGVESNKQEINSEKKESTKSDAVNGSDSNKQEISSEKKQNAESDDLNRLTTKTQEIYSEHNKNTESDPIKGLESKKQDIYSEKNENAESDDFTGQKLNEQGIYSRKIENAKSDSEKGLRPINPGTNINKKEKDDSQGPKSNKEQGINSQKKQDLESDSSDGKKSNEAQIINGINQKGGSSNEKQRANSGNKYDSNSEIGSVGADDGHQFNQLKTTDKKNISISLGQIQSKNVTPPLAKIANEIYDKNMHQKINSKMQSDNVNINEKAYDKLDSNKEISDRQEEKQVEQPTITPGPKLDDVPQTISTNGGSMLSSAAASGVTALESDLNFAPNSTNATDTVTFINAGNSSNNTTNSLFDAKILNQSLDSVVAAHLEPGKGEDYKEMSPINSLITVLTIVGVLLASVGAIIWWYRKNWQSGSYDAVQSAGQDSMEHVNISMNMMNKRPS